MSTKFTNNPCGDLSSVCQMVARHNAYNVHWTNNTSQVLFAYTTMKLIISVKTYSVNHVNWQVHRTWPPLCYSQQEMWCVSACHRHYGHWPPQFSPNHITDELFWISVLFFWFQVVYLPQTCIYFVGKLNVFDALCVRQPWAQHVY